MAGQPTGTVTFLFTDVEGSTRMWERDPTAMRSALARHDEILRSAIEESGGSVFKTMGDAFCAAFFSVPGALDAALSAQRALHAEEWDEGSVIRVRMALHTGAVEERGGDYFGPALNWVSRLLSAGHGGQTLLSLAAQELVRDALPVDVRLEDLGERRLKDLFRPERVFEISAPDHPSEFPPLRTLESHSNNLPLQPTPLVGREREVLEVCGRLRQEEVRLLTLTGPGGTGKTRLALQAAADLLEDFDDGVFFVALATVTDPDLFLKEIAAALGLQESGDAALEEILKEYLGRRELLLVLDNFEQILSAAPLAGGILSAAPRLKVLVTSRIPLGIYGEHEYAVPPLSIPDPKRLPDIGALSQFESVRLFIERAGAAKAGFEITNENAPAVAEICARLDGLPLAIELAAARIKLLPPKAILTRLANRLKLLTGGAKDLPARQRTLRGAIEWSHDLLDEGERTLFARLAVFSGGRTLEAIEAVCDAEGDLPIDAFDGVSSLLDKSLLTRDEGPQEEPRFVMLETIHEYAREKLEESGEAEETKRLHAEYFLSFAEEAEPELVGAEQIEWMDRLEAEHDNLRAALSWSMEAAEVESVLRMAGSLSLFWSVRGYSSEGRGWCEEALARDADHESPMRAMVLGGLGIMAWRQSDYERAEQSLGESLALYRGSGDGKGEAISLLYLGKAAIDRNELDLASELLSEGESMCRSVGDTANLADILNISAIVAMARGDLVGANTILEEALGLARAAGHIRCLALTTSNLGINAMLEGDYEEARALMEEALELNLALKDRGNHAVSLHNLGLIALLRGDPEQAAVLCAQSTQMFGDLLDSIGVTISLDALAAVSGQRGEVGKAVRLWGAAQALRDAMRVSQPPDDKEVLEPFVEAARSSLEAAAFRAAWEEGRAMTQEQAVALALQDIGNGEHTARAEPA